MTIGSRRVGCKISRNRVNAPAPRPSVKKRKTVLLDEEQMKKEGLRDWEEPEDEFKGYSIMSIHHDITGTFSSEGEDFYRPDSPYLPDSRLDYGTNGTHFSTEGEDSHLSDKTAEGNSEETVEDFYRPNSPHLPDSPYRPDSPYLLDSRLGDNNNTYGTHFSMEGGDCYVPDSRPQHKTAEGSSENEETTNGESLVDMWACGVCKAAAVSTLAFPCCHLCPCWDCEFEVNNCPICGVARTDGRVFTSKDGDSHPPNSPQYNINGNRFPAEGGDFYHQNSCLQCSINGTHFSAQGGDSYRLDSHPQHNTEIEEATEAKSQVDKWACRVCKTAEVSIVVLPCRHICLCWDCEPETDSCPICGEAKADIFYIRNT